MIKFSIIYLTKLCTVQKGEIISNLKDEGPIPVQYVAHIKPATRLLLKDHHAF